MTSQADLAGIARYVTAEMTRLRIPGLALGIVSTIYLALYVPGQVK